MRNCAHSAARKISLKSCSVSAVFISMMWILLVLLGASSMAANGHGRCRPLRIDFCQDVSYSTTCNNPRGMGHYMKNGGAEAMRRLIETGCSPYAAELMCRVVAPPLRGLVGEERTVPPCRALCERVRRDCERVLKERGIPWPPRIKCSALPAKYQLVCVDVGDKPPSLSFFASVHESESLFC